MIEKLKRILMNHKLVRIETNELNKKVVVLKCQCGTPAIREEAWAQHVAHMIAEEFVDE